MATDLTISKNNDMAVRDFEHRIFEYLPGAKDVPQPIRLAMAQIAIAHGLDPFLKEVWPIPQKNRNGEIVGWDLMIGIAGWRSSAWRSNEYWGRRFEKCSQEERGWLGAQPNDIAIRCVVMRRRTGQQPMEFDGYGLFRSGHEFTKMNPLQCARYRAERDAMKAAFPISLPAGINAKVVEDETGEVINGAVDHGPKWEVATEIQEEEPAPIVQVTTDHDAELEAQIMSDAPKPEPEPKAEAPGKFRMAHPVFNGMTIDQWHSKADKFCSEHVNWQRKDGRPDLNHVLASAGQAGFETITGTNIDAVFAAIVAAHEAKA